MEGRKREVALLIRWRILLELFGQLEPASGQSAQVQQQTSSRPSKSVFSNPLWLAAANCVEGLNYRMAVIKGCLSRAESRGSASPSGESATMSTSAPLLFW